MKGPPFEVIEPLTNSKPGVIALSFAVVPVLFVMVPVREMPKFVAILVALEAFCPLTLILFPEQAPDIPELQVLRVIGPTELTVAAFNA